MAINLFAPLNEQNKKDVLVSFKAGRMTMLNDGSKMVSPDRRKGLVILKLSDDSLVHFIWKDRTTGTEETNLILFPNDATFRKIDNARRVYLLEWTTTDKKLFFWMQEPKDDKDQEYCENINKFINNPPQPQLSGGLSGLGGLAGLGALGGLGGLGALGGGIPPEQLMQLLGSNPDALSGILGGRRGGRTAGNTTTGTSGSQRPTSTGSSSSEGTKSTSSSTTGTAPAPSSTTSTTKTQSSTSAAPAGGVVQLDTLQRILQELNQSTAKGPSLKDVINVDEIINSGLFDIPEVVAKLAEFLPEGSGITSENLKDNVRSPQFSQAVSMFNHALRSGQMVGIMQSFGLDTSQVGANATIEDFLKAIQKKAKEEKEKK